MFPFFFNGLKVGAKPHMWHALPPKCLKLASLKNHRPQCVEVSFHSRQCFIPFHCAHASSVSMAEFNQAQSYDEDNSAIQRRVGLDLMKLLAPPKGSKVLDLGCGTGFLTKTLADLVGPEGRVVGIDPDLERLKVAREKYPASNLQYLEGSAVCIPDDGVGELYDLVFCNFVLHWVKDKDAVFKEVSAKLKSGGKFGFVCLNHDVIKAMSRPPLVYSPQLVEAFASRMHYTPWEELSQIVSKNGFEVVDTKFFAVTQKFSGFSEFVRFHMAHMGGEYDQKHFNADAVREHYGEGEISIDDDVISVVLCKT